jgi:hypothetical protein
MKLTLFGTSSFIVLISTCIVLLIYGCRKDENYFEGKANIEISTDTLYFDTLFTSIGSSTKYIKIYNKEETVIVVDLKIEAPSKSFFRMNADGFQGNNLKNIEIRPNDSIYVFVEVTVDPNKPLTDSPFIIEENLVITQGSQKLNVLFAAWGQNANYLSTAGTLGLLSCEKGSITFNDPKPYVIYGILLIDDCNVIIPRGTRIYVHGGIGFTDNGTYNDGQIIVLDGGKLTVNGTVDLPVIFEGDRLEPDYKEISGQWGGIRIFEKSKGNLMQHTIIRNSIIGMVVDSGAELTLKNSIIHNSSNAGIIGIHSNINIENSLVYNNGSYAIQLIYGGSYDFKYCTIGSFFNQREAIVMNNKKCLDLQNDILCTKFVDVFPARLSMTNCIITGSSSDEISFDDFTGKTTGNDFFFDLKNCVVKVNELLLAANYPNFFDNCKSCYNLKSQDKLFLDQNKNVYTLDTVSVALEKALPISNILKDLKDRARDGAKPDVGCYEF